MKHIVRMSVVLLPAIAVACTEAHPPPQSPAAATMLAAPPASTCPLGVEGATVLYEDTATGGRLTFTAPKEKLDELRERARDASALHGTGQKLGKGHDGKHGNGGHHGLKAMQLPPAYGGEEDIEGGARINVTPADAHDLEVLRTKLRERAREMMRSCS